MTVNRFTSKSPKRAEHIIEWCIRGIASVSIILIFLIFLFVFREALTVFSSADSAPAPAHAVTSANGPAPPHPPPMEAAPSDAVSANNATGHLFYSPRNPLYPDIYNAETGELPADIDDVNPAPDQAPSHRETSLANNLAGSVWQPVGEHHQFGVMPLLVGTAKTTLIAILFGAPLGILAAIYTAFFAGRKTREFIKPIIELLAGFPSVVIGFFCLTTLASVLQTMFHLDFRLNALVGGIGLSLAVLPIVYSLSEEALSAVPRTLREASLALGSTEWQTAYRVMLPAAAPGVIAAVILGIGRAFGETMIAIMATGNAPLGDWNPFMPARTLAATIGSEMGEVVWGSEHYGVLFLLGAFLLIVSFVLNSVTEYYVKKRLIKKFQGH